MHKQIQFLNIVQAFQHFAGKSLKVTDVADNLDQKYLDSAENMLREVAVQLDKLDREQWPDLHRLKNEIIQKLDRRF